MEQGQLTKAASAAFVAVVLTGCVAPAGYYNGPYDGYNTQNNGQKHIQQDYARRAALQQTQDPCAARDFSTEQDYVNCYKTGGASLQRSGGNASLQTQPVTRIDHLKAFIQGTQKQGYQQPSGLVKTPDYCRVEKAEANHVNVTMHSGVTDDVIGNYPALPYQGQGIWARAVHHTEGGPVQASIAFGENAEGQKICKPDNLPPIIAKGPWIDVPDAFGWVNDRVNFLPN